MSRTRLATGLASAIACAITVGCGSATSESGTDGVAAEPMVVTEAEEEDASADDADADTGTADDDAADGEGDPSAASSDEARIEGTFDVGGHELYLLCEGTGSPTILYLHGAISEGGFNPHGNGRHTQARLSDDHRVCVYDRRNVGRSDTVDAEQRPEDVIADLHGLLAAAEVEPPYVLLGASFGGVVGYLYLNAYPDDVVGMVQLDSMFPDELEHEQLLPEGNRYEAFSEEDACCTLERIDHFAMLSPPRSSSVGSLPCL
jgi:hypothetical protein